MLEKFQQDMIKAMKEKNKEELSVLRMAKGAMDKIRIDQKKEVDKIIDEAFVELAPQGMKDMGKVMSMVSPKVKGCFDMGVVSSKIKSRLS